MSHGHVCVSTVMWVCVMGEGGVCSCENSHVCLSVMHVSNEYMCVCVRVLSVIYMYRTVMCCE